MATFRGWSAAAVDFYTQLEGDNSRSFWLAHKAIYDAEVRAPFDALNELVEAEFGPLKVFRPNRDVRFSADKSPYKTRCYALTEDEGGASYYVEVSAKGVVAATGYWMMDNEQLARYRQAIDGDDAVASVLRHAIDEVTANGFGVEGQALKTAPRGYRRDHPEIELLRHRSVAVIKTFAPARWMHTGAAADRIIDVWRAGRPVNDWLARYVGPSRSDPR